MDEQAVFHRCRFDVSRTIGPDLLRSKLKSKERLYKIGLYLASNDID